MIHLLWYLSKVELYACFILYFFSESDYSCEREVSTIICIKNQICENCNCLEGRSTCDNKTCKCRSSHKQSQKNESIAGLEENTMTLGIDENYQFFIWYM